MRTFRLIMECIFRGNAPHAKTWQRIGGGGVMGGGG